MSASPKDMLVNDAADQDPSSDDEGFLNLPKPSAPYSTKSNDESEDSKKNEETVESTPQMTTMLSQEESVLSMSGPLTNDTDSDSESSWEDEGQFGKRLQRRESSTQFMLQLLTNQVYEYTLKTIPTGCSVKFEDTEEEFSRKAGRYDTQQALKSSTRVFKLFSEDLSKWGLKLNSGHRMHDAMSWSQYESQREFLRHFRGAQWPLDERYLFCGARPNASKGFDIDLHKRKGRLGVGFYFTDSPLKAFMHASNYTVECIATILVCRVLLGESKLYADEQRRTDTDQRREPLKEKVDGKLVYYDSVCGRPKDFKEYVVYQNSRVFIEYALEVSEDFLSLRRKVEKIFEQRDQPTVQMLVPSRLNQTDYAYPRYTYAQPGSLTGYTPGQMNSRMDDEELTFSEGSTVRLEDVLRQRFKTQPQRSTITSKPDTFAQAPIESSPLDEEKPEQDDEVREPNPPGNFLGRFLPPPSLSLFSLRQRNDDNKIGSTASVRPRAEPYNESSNYGPMDPSYFDPDLQDRSINGEINEEKNNADNEEPIGEMPPDAEDLQFMHLQLGMKLTNEKPKQLQNYPQSGAM